jgi:hypothetical protein
MKNNNSTHPMRCPYCDNIFPISDTQIQNNSTFKCPYCEYRNCGSICADSNGVLIGIKAKKLDLVDEIDIVDLQRSELHIL